jgi:hypothetical protein
MYQLVSRTQQYLKTEKLLIFANEDFLQIQSEH